MHSPHSESFNYPDIGCLTFDATEMGHTERDTCMLIIPAHTHMDCHSSQFIQCHLPYFVSFLCLPLPLFLMSAFYMYMCVYCLFLFFRTVCLWLWSAVTPSSRSTGSGFEEGSTPGVWPKVRGKRSLCLSKHVFMG